ncbi:MAG: YbjN domain-containing protein [Candidatus Eremiobacteraeota bacterium]|nr:YbjN domain-containing protein [Candidatus Eremiobacteraeota bacterium]MBC5826643.1 YbjN domain-containing protein [Candidatus Eremiobacteraeota bacterium]
MSVPSVVSLLIPIVKAIASSPGATLSELNCIIPKLFVADGSPPEETPEFRRRIAAVVKHLLREGYIESGEGGALRVTEEALPSEASATALSTEGGAPANTADRGTLAPLLSEAGFRFHSVKPDMATLEFHNKLRPWTVMAWANDGWLCLRSFIMAVPELPALRMRLQEKLLELNTHLYMTKYSVAEKNAVYAELEYRLEHLNGENINQIIGSFLCGLDAQYATLFRIAAGDESLAELEQAYKRDEAA